MGSNVCAADVLEVLERHHVRYEIRPHYDMLDLVPARGQAMAQRVQTGFDVDLYGVLLETEHLPLYHSEAARMVVDYFEKVAQDIQSRVGQQCTVQVITYEDSVALDTKHDFRPEVMLRIWIYHSRGLDQAEGSPEEQALGAIRGALRELKVREASE